MIYGLHKQFLKENILYKNSFHKNNIFLPYLKLHIVKPLLLQYNLILDNIQDAAYLRAKLAYLPRCYLKQTDPFINKFEGKSSHINLYTSP